MNARTAVVLSVALHSTASLGDGAWMRERRDELGRVVSVVPRQHTEIGMARERVSLVPFLDGGVVRLFVNVRYAFANPGAPASLLVGFPELRGRIVERDCGYECGPGRVTTHAILEAFAADVGGPPLPVQTLPGDGPYARWFVFTVPFATGETSLRNLYVANAGVVTTATNTNQSLVYSAEYVLHTGAQWAGSIGAGEIDLWDGGPQVLRRFTALRPTTHDDVHVPLDVAVTPSAGRPLFLWDYGNGQQGESVTPRRDDGSLVQQSSALPGGALAHLGAMALDGDPGTAWIDQGAHGGVGEWLQVPTRRLGRRRALVVQGGPTAPGTAHVRRLDVTCLDLEGNARTLTAMDRATVLLADVDGPQRVLLPRPMGPCHAVRLGVAEMNGPPTSHAGLAEVAFVD